MLELAVLGLLSEQPRHGYDLKKRLSETLGPLWGISFGSLYPALRRLERSGAIEETESVDVIPISRKFAAAGMFSVFPVDRSSTTVTSHPSDRSRSAT